MATFKKNYNTECWQRCGNAKMGGNFYLKSLIKKDNPVHTENGGEGPEEPHWPISVPNITQWEFTCLWVSLAKRSPV